MNSEKILVLMSTYNGEKYLVEQVESIFNQKGNYDISLLIRDDGSNDMTINIIQKLKEKYKKIKFIKGSNLGCNGSYFELFKLAYKEDFDFFAISDQDDIWLDDKISKALYYIQNYDQNQPILYGSASYLVRDDKIPYGKTQTANKEISVFNTIIQNFFPGHSQVFNRALLQYLIVDIDVSNIYVYDSWITNIANNFGKVIFDNEPHTLYRMHERNVVGYGKSQIQWLKTRINRMKKGDIIRQTQQIEYFLEVYGKKLNQTFLNEMNFFLVSRKNIFSRLKYIVQCKLYRQKTIETIYFKALYLFGKYNHHLKEGYKI
ncbi:MAG: glycosyltransferase [Massilimicrobiota sp.]|nr:glycosyltransferase [Massilimicrobiota sp.]